jgi:hypothetical protein
MNQEHSETLDPRIRSALAELEGAITQHYPTARFEVSRGHDEPENIHLTAIVDVEDTDQVLDLVIDRVVDLQVEEGLPIHVIPIRTPERVLAAMAGERSRRQPHQTRTVPLVGRPL